MNCTGTLTRGCKLKRSLRLVLVVLLAATLLTSFNVQSAFATPTSAEVQAQADEVSARLAIAEEEMHSIRAEYWAAVEAHEQALANMDEAQERIDVAQGIIKETQELLGARANLMYRQGPLSFLEVIFGAASFEEFTNTWDFINMINQENANLIQINKDARAEAEAAHAEFSAQQIVAAEREAEAAAIQVRAEELIAEQQVELAGLNAEVARLVEEETAARLAAEAAAEAERLRQQQMTASQQPSYDYSPPPPPPAGGFGDVVSAAASRIGCPYVYGATGPDYYDCSGLTSWSYQQAGLGWIGRTDGSQYASASARWPYTSGGAVPGDVLWWPGHVAIYAGGGSYIHAPIPGQSVRYDSWNIGNAVVLRF